MIRISATFFPFLLAAAACSSSPTETSDTTGITTTDTGTTSATDTGTTTTTDTGPGSSQGQGGIPCSTTGVASEGGKDYTYCVAKAGSVEMKIVEPEAGGSGPLHLAVYLHGDGAGPYGSHFDLRRLAPWTTTHHVLLVSALAPNACAWWLKPSYTTCDAATPVPDDAVDTGGENAEALKAAIEALRAGWDIADRPVLFGGSSGGSIFLSASFLPLLGDQFPGAWALSCGGDAPWAGGLGWDGKDPALASANKLFYTYGDKDFVVPDVLESIEFYERMGIATDVKVIPEMVANGGTSHCGNVGGSYSYDQIGRVAEVWSSYLVE
jgi:predicted esterase